MPATSSYFGGSLDVSSPGTRAEPIVTSDTVDMSESPRSIYVGGAGDVKMNGLNGGSAVTFKNVPAGSLIPFRPNRIYATGTTATLMLAIY